MQKWQWMVACSVLWMATMPSVQAQPRGVDNPDKVGLMGWVHTPPTNIRSAPNGKIQCVVRREGYIRLFGSSGVQDSNGEWYYTDYCGKMGMIHTTQFVIPD
ncbi:hypothetical protein ADP71_20900 [Vitreoscilla sp. C1]|uniref:hypothetical protein n=1 Tax=Vitreoscilla sp. (strain C1) TaxID=96942 RepID=UPI00148E9885|nr:hypothetical protein [Vitreoscilla sp. C1]AUZ05537.2 hypothetical protein ADP71_20900 [Vitreoscilla sp. C1]